jgi:hypothetical protein
MGSSMGIGDIFPLPDVETSDNQILEIVFAGFKSNLARS